MRFNIEDCLAGKHDKELNEEICAWRGWRAFPYPGYKGGILLPYKWSRSPTEHAMELPNHTGGRYALNYLHEAEAALSEQEQIRFERTLWNLVRPSSVLKGADGFSHCVFQIAHAGALVRAIALLSVIAPDMFEFYGQQKSEIASLTSAE